MVWMVAAACLIGFFASYYIGALGLVLLAFLAMLRAVDHSPFQLYSWKLPNFTVWIEWPASVASNFSSLVFAYEFIHSIASAALLSSTAKLSAPANLLPRTCAAE